MDFVELPLCHEDMWQLRLSLLVIGYWLLVIGYRYWDRDLDTRRYMEKKYDPYRGITRSRWPRNRSPGWLCGWLGPLLKSREENDVIKGLKREKHV